MWRNLLVLSVLVALVAGTLSAGAAESASTGLDRARQAASEAAAAATGLASDDAPEKVTGRERAARAIAAALERGEEGEDAKKPKKDKESEDNGNGHGWGRGHSAAVHEILAAGGSPSEIAGEHGKAVREMVHAYNALKKQAKDAKKAEKGSP
jgi:hypothetical protein